ncbi:hypothetical protein NL676_030540 [Syzygium grande]|nr:hypothetical protein NL676_030540 [Syzygium grande]
MAKRIDFWGVVTWRGESGQCRGEGPRDGEEDRLLPGGEGGDGGGLELADGVEVEEGGVGEPVAHGDGSAGGGGGEAEGLAGGPAAGDGKGGGAAA